MKINVACGGGSSRVPAHVGAMRVLRSGYNVQKVLAASVGAISGTPVAAGVDQPTLEDLVRNLDMHGLVRSTKRSVATVLREGGRFSLAGPIAELREVLARYGNGGEGVETFGDLRPLDSSYASTLQAGDAWRLNVRVWTVPTREKSGLLALLSTFVRLAWADRRFGEAHSTGGDARLKGIFSRMATRHLPGDTVEAHAARGDSIDAATSFARSLPIAEVAALTMALPATFPPGRFPDALPDRTFDGAMLERVPARRFGKVERYPAALCPASGNDLFRLADGRPDPTPAIAIAMEQPNRFTTAQQAEWDWRYKTAKHGIFVIRLPHLGIRLTDYATGQRRADELIDAAVQATTVALASEPFQLYLASRQGA